MLSWVGLVEGVLLGAMSVAAVGSLEVLSLELGVAWVGLVSTGVSGTVASFMTGLGG